VEGAAASRAGIIEQLHGWSRIAACVVPGIHLRFRRRCRPRVAPCVRPSGVWRTAEAAPLAGGNWWKPAPRQLLKAPSTTIDAPGFRNQVRWHVVVLQVMLQFSGINHTSYEIAHVASCTHLRHKWSIVLGLGLG